MKLQISAITLSLALALGTFTMDPPSAHATSLTDQLEDTFNAMSNYTAPGAYQTQSRGVLAGGGLKVRIPNNNLQVISVSPPSMKVGCNGIDMYFGSLSYLKKEDVMAFLRTVAAASLAFGFEAALYDMCPTCQTILTNLRHLANLINQMNGNACELGRKIGTALADKADLKPNALEDAAQTAVAGINKAAGIVNDFNETWKDIFTPFEIASKAGGSTAQEAKEMMTGNVVWKIISRPEFRTAYKVLGSGDKEGLFQIMSLTGTVIRKRSTEQKGQTNTEKADNQKYPPLLTMEILIEGRSGVPAKPNGQAINEQDPQQIENKTYVCRDPDFGNDGCLDIREEPFNFEGLANKIKYVLVGKDGAPGLIDKMAAFQEATAPTEREKSVMAALPASVGSMLRNLALTSPAVAKSFVPEIANIVALHIVHDQAQKVLRDVEIAMRKSSEGDQGLTSSLLTESRKNINTEFMTLSERYGRMDDVIQKYVNLTQLFDLRKPNEDTKRGPAGPTVIK